MRICLITPGQPSNNPRLVKEADALAEAGYNVHAICADCGLWPSLMDNDLMKERGWTYEYAAASSRRVSGLLRRTRYKAAKYVADRAPVDSTVRRAALSPVAPELERAAMRVQADLYIAHHPAALPAAARAAMKFRTKFGYDAEDLQTGMWPYSVGPGPSDRLTEQIEARYLPSCSHLTTAAPGFSIAYAEKFGIKEPSAILNVFPLSERPGVFRPSEHRQPLRLYWFSQCIGEKRGLEDAVRALGLLPGSHIELHLRGNWQDGFREKLFRLAGSVGLSHDRMVIHPPAPPDQMIRLSAEFDVGLALEQPIDENKKLCLSNKLFVYLLAGNALAATNLPGQKSITDNLENAAFSYEPGEIEGLAAGIQRWYADRQLLNAARERAWAWGTERYNWDLEKKYFLSVVGATMRESRPAPTIDPPANSLTHARMKV